MKKITCICTAIVIILMARDAIFKTSCGPCECHTDLLYERGYKAVCSGFNLTEVPQLPNKTTTLLMENNNFDFLPPKAFFWMKNLKHLDLSDNKFLSLGDQVFSGLHHLEELVLDGNHLLSVNKSYFDPVFLKPLLSLRVLSVLDQRMATPYLLYWGSSYSHSLQSLYIDCTFCEFDSSFLRLKKLSLLSLVSDRVGSGCALYDIGSFTFQYTPYLTTLNISDCVVYNAFPGMFSPLHTLKTLDMSIYLTHGDESNVFIEATKSLQSSSIEYIKFSSHYPIEINLDFFSSLKNTTLKELHLIDSLYILDLHAFENLPNSLEVFELKYFENLASGIFTELNQHPSLKTLDLTSNHKDLDYIPGGSPFSLSVISPLLETYICRDCYFSNLLVFRLPRKDAKIETKNVKTLIIPNNGIKYFSPNTCLQMPYVEYIDIRNNRLDNLPQFSPNNSISYFNVANNRLGNFLASDNTTALESLSNLQIVDFSHNNVFSLSTIGLDLLLNVKFINISNNYLETVNVRLLHLTNLEVIDLRNNKIHAIGEDTRYDISTLTKARLNLDGNPLVCGCNELDSLLWMKHNKKRVDNLKSLKCRLSTGKHESLTNLDEIITNLKTACKSYLVEISVSVSLTICLLSLFAGVLVYRNRWKLRYLYYAGRRGYRRRFNEENVPLEEYEYEAFVAYADQDRRFVIDEMIKELEGEHGLKLCVHHRDFLPGEIISENIVNAIQNSRKTIVVLSPSFLKSDWCEFEFNMARMEGVTRRQDIVLVLLYEDVSMMNLSKDMATMLKRNCYLEYNHELYNKEIFWYNVQESIQTTRQWD